MIKKNYKIKHFYLKCSRQGKRIIHTWAIHSNAWESNGYSIIMKKKLNWNKKNLKLNYSKETPNKWLLKLKLKQHFENHLNLFQWCFLSILLFSPLTKILASIQPFWHPQSLPPHPTRHNVINWWKSLGQTGLILVILCGSIQKYLWGFKANSGKSGSWLEVRRLGE